MNDDSREVDAGAEDKSVVASFAKIVSFARWRSGNVAKFQQVVHHARAERSARQNGAERRSRKDLQAAVPLNSASVVAAVASSSTFARLLWSRRRRRRPPRWSTFDARCGDRSDLETSRSR